MKLHGANGDIERVGDLLVCATADNSLEHFVLPAREFPDRVFRHDEVMRDFCFWHRHRESKHERVTVRRFGDREQATYLRFARSRIRAARSRAWRMRDVRDGEIGAGVGAGVSAGIAGICKAGPLNGGGPPGAWRPSMGSGVDMGCGRAYVRPGVSASGPITGGGGAADW